MPNFLARASFSRSSAGYSESRLPRALLALAPADLPRLYEVQLDEPVLLFAAAGTLLSVLLFGLAPSVGAVKTDIVSGLKLAGGGSSGREGIRGILAVAEVSLSIVLLVSASLLLRSFIETQRVNPGFSPERMLLLHLSLPKGRYQTAASIGRFYDGLRNRIAVVPGLETVALASVLPLSGMNNRSEILVSGAKPASPADVPAAQYRWVSPGYFQVMRIPMIAGREFTAFDNDAVAGVAVVDLAMVNKCWPGRSPLGQHFNMLGKDYEVVGVSGNVKHNNLEEDPTATVYAPFLQVPRTNLSFLLNGFSLIVRTHSNPEIVATPIRRALRNFDSEVPASSVKTMDQALVKAVAPRRFNMQLMGVLAASALLLAVMGLYGVISHSVALRTREIGIRVALGCTRSEILLWTIGKGLRLGIIGIAIGNIAAFAAARAGRSLLFQTGASDLVPFVGVSLIFVLISIAAVWIPAQRATRIDPLSALRME